MSEKGKKASLTEQVFESWASYVDSPEALIPLFSIAQKTAPHISVRQCIIFDRGRMSDLQFMGGVSEFNPSASIYQVNFPTNDPEKNLTGLFAILPSKFPNLYRLTTVSASDFWARAMRKIVRRLYPSAVSIYFKQTEIYDALKTLENSLAGKFVLTVDDATMKGTKIKNSLVTDRHWAELSISEIFDLAAERGLWFTSLKFNIKQRLGQSDRFKNIASGRLYKHGEVHFEWLYDQISQNLIEVLEEYASQKLSLLENRGIKERNYRAGYPLELVYEEDIFSDIHEVRRFGDVISKYPSSSRAVFHSNPYYHASVADFLDGSSFELWVLSPSRVILVPQAKSSTQALERITSYIFDEFKEGAINEYKGD